MTITKLEDSENHRNAFEISGDEHKLCESCLSRWWDSLPFVCRFVWTPSEGCGLSVVKLYSGCAHVHVCAFYLFSHFSLLFSSLLGSMIERILVSCNNQQDLHEWVDHLQKQTKVTSVGNPPIKPHSVPSHTVRTPILLNSRGSFWLTYQQVIK